MVADAAHAFAVCAVPFGNFDHHFGMFAGGRRQVGQSAARFDRVFGTAKQIPSAAVDGAGLIAEKPIVQRFVQSHGDSCHLRK